MKYNGWTNYETWSVHNKITGDLDWYECEYVNADYLKDLVEEIVFHHRHTLDGEQTLMSDFAHDFLSEVNYNELAEHYITQSINERDERLG